jgi:hypothetical protein
MATNASLEATFHSSVIGQEEEGYTTGYTIHARRGKYSRSGSVKARSRKQF